MALVAGKYYVMSPDGVSILTQAIWVCLETGAPGGPCTMVNVLAPNANIAQTLTDDSSRWKEGEFVASVDFFGQPFANGDLIEIGNTQISVQSVFRIPPAPAPLEDAICAGIPVSVSGASAVVVLAECSIAKKVGRYPLPA